MPVTLSIKNVPEFIAQNLSVRANQNHRTLQGELMAILEEAVNVRASQNHRSLQGELRVILEKTVEVSPPTPSQILAKVQQLGLFTPAESVDMIRGDRDDR